MPVERRRSQTTGGRASISISNDSYNNGDFSDFDPESSQMKGFCQRMFRHFGRCAQSIKDECFKLNYKVSYFGHFCCLTISQSRKEKLKIMMNHPLYKISNLLFVSWMFLGSVFSDLFCPVDKQIYFDIVSVIVFMGLMADIGFSLVIDESYFHFHCFFCPCWDVNWENAISKRQSFLSAGGVGKTKMFSCGSLFFWSDLVTTVSVLTEISWFYPSSFGSKQYTIDLEQVGLFNTWVLPYPSMPINLSDTTWFFIVLQTIRLIRLQRLILVYKLYNFNIVFHQYNLCNKETRRKLRKNFVKPDACEIEAATVIARNWKKYRSAFDPSLSGTRVTSQTNSIKDELHVGNALRDSTARSVSVVIFLTVLLSFFLIYEETPSTIQRLMVMLHSQTQVSPKLSDVALESAHSVVPYFYQYILSNGKEVTFINQDDIDMIRERDKIIVNVTDSSGNTTTGYFDMAESVRNKTWCLFSYLIFILVTWTVGVSIYIGPVMTLIVTPIQRMSRLLHMIMTDPLGYQTSTAYKIYEQEGKEIPAKSGWTEEQLEGMETSFLLSTISRIASLMKVGFGSAGVEIIRNSLTATESRAGDKSAFFMNLRGSSTLCIFMFCDIRQFTDCTESLQEEVFVFTNKVASIIHSFISAYGGSANKNIGDAFLLSWQLGDDGNDGVIEGHSPVNALNPAIAKHYQADKALLSVIKILFALYVDTYFLDELSEKAKNRLLEKLANRIGPVVQIGFGLHAGKAVQGAIGSQRKIDPSYISEAVSLSEFLESSTKRYGVNLLLSGAFYSILNPSNRRRCRKIDRVLISDEENEELIDYDNMMDLYTFDVDVEAYWTHRRETRGKKETYSKIVASLSDATFLQSFAIDQDQDQDQDQEEPDLGIKQVDLPVGTLYFNMREFSSIDIEKACEKFSEGYFYHIFDSGFEAFYKRDWNAAKYCFQTILKRFPDGPSRYFLDIIKKHKGVPPPHFKTYSTE